MSDDTPRPTVTRRRAVGLAGALGGAAVLAQVAGPERLLATLGLGDDARAAAAACTLTPDKTEGPYFVDEKLDRSDIRSDPSDGTVQPGVPVRLTMVVVRDDGDCAPVPGATVDVWHANAAGLYSDESANRTAGKRYLRGSQVTDDGGKVTFTTIYPGWYQGRAVHIHFKVRLFDGTRTTYAFTSQLFFDPDLSAAVYETAAYRDRGTPDTSNAADGIYGSDGAKLLVRLTGDGSGGYAGTFVVGVDGVPASTATPGAATVDASVTSLRWRRTASGRRVLRLTAAVGESVSVSVRLSRSGSTLARRKATALRTGTRTVDLPVGQGVARGGAKATVTFTDGGGATKSTQRTVTVPRRAG